MLSVLRHQNFRSAVAVPSRTAPLRFSVFLRTTAQHGLNRVPGNKTGTHLAHFRLNNFNVMEMAND